MKRENNLLKQNIEHISIDRLSLYLLMQYFKKWNFVNISLLRHYSSLGYQCSRFCWRNNVGD